VFERETLVRIDQNIDKENECF